MPTTTAAVTLPAADLSGEALAGARRELSRLLAATSDADERIIRERLSRYGLPLLPEVYARLKDAPGDDARRRLRALRYRLVASDRLALSWMDGLERLAAVEQPRRIAALDELSKRATPADQRLLLELFADPDPLFRERSLRVLKSIGGAGATGAMATLLRDPEPNVRAAVLKQLAEQPPHEMIGEVVRYVESEGDADLIVHSVRVLRAAKGEESLAALKKLLAHESWRVRAEAVEAIDDLADDMQQEQKASTYGAMIRLLDDPDGFVIARAVTALGKANLVSTIEPMARAAKKHPQLAGDVVAAMTRQSNLGQAAMPHLREFATHASPAVRAAAITGLCEIDPQASVEQISAALRDGESEVRLAAAGGLLDALAELLPPESTETSFLGMRRTVRNDRGKWLDDFRAGTGRPKWLDAPVPALEPMLKAAAPEERAAAAGPLLAAGRDEPALGILQSAAKEDAKARLRAASALTWLPWEKRLALFNLIAATKTDDDQLHRAVNAMASSGDARAADPLWELLKDPAANVKTLDAVVDGLRRAYFGDRYYDTSQLTDAQKKPAIEAMKQKAQDGPELQKSAALVLLLGVSLDDAAAQGKRLLEDPSSGEWMRIDALQVLLLSSKREAGEELALKHLADAVLIKVALPYVALGGNALNQLRGEVYLYFNNPANNTTVMQGNGQPIVVEPPKEMPTEALTRLLHGPDPKMAAYAAYLLALGGDRKAFDVLRDYWQTNEKDDHEWQRLVYRAASAVNDDSLTPTIEEIYRLIGPGDWRLREFYWTIRNMKGEKILRLRKQIREEAGMDRLR